MAIHSYVKRLFLAIGLLSAAQLAMAMTSRTPPDGNAHPGVVALLRSDGYWARPFCTGMLLSGKVVLTASHCMYAAINLQNGGWQLLASNDTTLQRDANGWLPVSTLASKSNFSQIVLNPAYNPATKGGYGHDVSAVVLATPITVDSSALGVLPPTGILDELQATGFLRTATFTLVGYGSQEMMLPAPKGQYFPFTSERRSGTLGFDALDPAIIHESQRISQGWDGAGYGDSGGPSLLKVGDTTFVVGVTSSGDTPCFATNTATRTDSSEALNLLANVLAANPDD